MVSINWDFAQKKQWSTPEMVMTLNVVGRRTHPYILKDGTRILITLDSRVEGASVSIQQEVDICKTCGQELKDNG